MCAAAIVRYAVSVRRTLHFITLGSAAALALGFGLAVAPAGSPGESRDGGWWSYRPLTRPDVPTVNDDAWVANPIDAFILSRIEQQGLSPAAEADKVTLIRRAYYDLLGLPPTPEEVAAFVADDAPDAWERLIDRLLESPHYGEKWGRHWLDIVRYAETDSFERDRPKPMAWKYRDYVVRAFNSDKPYDRFIIEQLAGDELPDATVDTLTATGYYRLGIWDDEPTDVKQAQYDDLDGVISTTAQAMLGMTIGCARCHDHKKDPIPQRDYYRFLAFFENIKPYKVNPGNSVNPENYLRSVPVDLGSSEFHHRLVDYAQRRDRLVSRLEEIRANTLAAEAKSPHPGHLPGGAGDAAAGPVVHLSFDETDDARFRHAMTAMQAEMRGTAVAADGRHGAARAFDGRRDFIRIVRPVQDDFTIAFWLRTTGTGPGGNDYRWFLGAGLVDGEVRGIVRDFGVSYHSDGRITAGTGEPETFIHSPPGYNDGLWHHVAFTRERSSGLIRLFVDGEPVAQAKGSTRPLDAPAHLDIGRMMPGYNHFRGDLDDVRLYARALSEHEILSLTYGEGFSPAFADRVRAALGEEEHRRYQEVLTDLRGLRKPVRETTEVLCVMEQGANPPDSFVRQRGNVHSIGEKVTPGYPSILGFPDPPTPPTPPTPPATSSTAAPPRPIDTRPDSAETSGRRLTLARWIASPENPLTARVMANRLWQHHFGRGIVRTPNDFGRLGEAPTHPELLDWLASEFTARQWSIKSMHRLIMTSSAYRMSSRGDARAIEADPENNLFTRFNMRRLTAEELRDSVLAMSGTLNLEMGGPSVYPPMPREVLQTASRPDQAWGRSDPRQAARRTIYIHIKRSLLMPLLVSFDMADTDNSCDVRFVTTQPTQALTLLNGEFMQEQAELFARRLEREAGGDHAAQIRHAFRLLTSRDPHPDDLRECLSLLEELRTVDAQTPEQAMKYLALMLLNLNEFVYLD